MKTVKIIVGTLAVVLIGVGVFFLVRYEMGLRARVTALEAVNVRLEDFLGYSFQPQLEAYGAKIKELQKK